MHFLIKGGREGEPELKRQNKKAQEEGASPSKARR